MNKYTLTKTIPLTLAASILLSGCGEQAECEIPTRHIHKYTKQVTDDITIEKYVDSEDLSLFGYKWNDEYIEINKVDEELFKVLKKKGLFDGETNWRYLYNEMATHHDYLMFYYEYTTTETYTTTDSDGNTSVHTRTVTHTGWTDNPNDINNTGKTRLYHHKYYGYRIIYENGKFKAEKSPIVDDIREVIEEYPYFSEDCVTEVFETFKFKRRELRELSPEDFTVFTGPDLDNPNLDTGQARERKIK